MTTTATLRAIPASEAPETTLDPGDPASCRPDRAAAGSRRDMRTGPAADRRASPGPAGAPAAPPAAADPSAGQSARPSARPAGDPAGDPAIGPATDPAAPGLPAAAPARMRRRHRLGLASFVALVLLPFLAATAYLYVRAADEYHSEVAFSVRSEEMGVASAGLLGALTSIGSGTASDSDILDAYIRSREIVEAVSARLDLRAIWNRPGTDWATGDPVFTLGDDPTVEALHAQWLRMVRVDYDLNAGIIAVTARAFTPGDARAIATAVLDGSSALVNALSDQARADAVRFASEELAEAEAHLAGVREALGAFRRAHNIVDPAADVAGQGGMLAALDRELAGALVERRMLASYAPAGDARLAQADRRIAAITAQIGEERAALGIPGVAGALPDVVGRYEALAVDLEFASTAYTQALAGLAMARAEARRQARYLAAHVRPTLATAPLYPRRALLAGMTGLFLLLGWGVAAIVWYNVRDSR